MSRRERREADAKYDQSPKGKLRKKRYQLGKERNGGPKSSPGPVGAAAQRERKSRPEYVLAKRLGISVAVAKEILSPGTTNSPE